MRAITYSKFGGPEVLTFSDVPAPQPTPNQVTVQVICAAINPFDWKLVRGDFQVLRGRRWPRFVGCDFSGRIHSVGSKVQGWERGDAVFGSAKNPLTGVRGALADFILASAGEIARKPDAISFEHAATLPIAGASALQCLELAAVEKNSEVLVIGASGGVGSYCARIATGRGARVTGVCSTANEEYVRKLGASEVIAYDRTDVLATGRIFDAIIDAAAVYDFSRCSRLLKPAGCYVLTNPGPAHFLAVSRSRIFGGKQARALLARITAQRLVDLAELAAAGRLDGIAVTRFAFEDVRAAFELSRSGHARGKLVIHVANDSGQSEEEIGE